MKRQGGEGKKRNERNICTERGKERYTEERKEQQKVWEQKRKERTTESIETRQKDKN